VVRAVVTGGAGFIGSHIVDAMVAAGGRVTVIDDLSTGSADQVNREAALIEWDVADGGVMERIASVRPDVVIHAAAQVSVSASGENPGEDRRVNLVGTEHVLAAAREAKTRRFVFVSSGGAIYGETRLATEATLPNPANPYGIHKLAAEGYVRTSGLSYAIARYSNVYGPRQRAGLEGGVVAVFANQLSRHKPVTIHGDGEQSRDFVFVADVVEATLLMARASLPGTWNVSSGTSTSVTSLLEALAELIAPPVRVDFEGPRRGDVRTSSLANDMIRHDLGWRPRHALRSGLRETVSQASGPAPA
jgi:UDP-glucose 4-epimerase